MIAHVSVPAGNPQQTALFFAALFGGMAFPFPVVPGGWIAVSEDRSGLAVEVYPATMAHHPGTGAVDPSVKPDGPQTMPWEDQIFPDGQQVRPTAFHLAVTSKLAPPAVLALAKARGWRALECERAGVFGVIEVWIDNTVLVEVLTGREVDRYTSFMNLEGVAAFFGAGQRP
jgi:hypothetical protein